MVNISQVDPRLIKNGKIMCPRCGKYPTIVHSAYGVMPCDHCNKKTDDNSGKPIVHRRPLTKWEERKLRFQRNEKAWHEDIKSRQVLPNGDVAVVKNGRITEVRTKDRRIIE